MKKHLNRLLALILCLGFVCSLIPALATDKEEDLYFRVENGKATLVGSVFDISGDVVIPAEYQGYPVTAIAAYAFSEECSVQSVTIPHTVTSIHREAFMCTTLKAFRVEQDNPTYSADGRGVLYNKEQTALIRAPLGLSGSYHVPSGVTVIEEYAFHLCFGLTEVTLPEGLTHIGQRAFDGCNKLSLLRLPESVSDIGVYAFSACYQIAYQTYGNGKYLGTANNPYHILIDAVNEAVTEATVHQDTKLIAGAAFRQCSVLERITIPEGLQRIGDWAFAGCSALRKLQLPHTLHSIGNDAFTESGLTEITIPEGVQTIGSGTFMDCETLTTVILPESLTSIGEKAFAETPLTEINLGKHVSKIGDAAFYGCWNLNAIWVDEANAFYCSDDKGVLFNKDQTVLVCAPQNLSDGYQMPNSVTRIEDYGFYRCTELTGLALPEGMTSIGNYAFSYCYNLETVTIPKNVTEVASGLFYGCGQLKTLSLPDGLTKIGDEAFCDCTYLKEIQIPESVTAIGESAFKYCSSLQSVTIPEGVEIINRYTFYGCYDLMEVSIPNSVRQVGSGAFDNCSDLTYSYVWEAPGRYLGNAENPFHVLIGVNNDDVEQITMDENTKVIADSALASCCELSSITMPEGLLTIGNYSFYCCESLRTVTIPNTVNYIGAHAFEKCRFTQIVIPASVRELGDYGFRACKKLTTVRFCGKLPLIGQDAFVGVTATAYCHKVGNEDGMNNYGGTLTWKEGHVFLSYLPDEDFRCTTGGTKTARCEGCDATDTVTVTETAEHRYNRGVCTVCGEIDTQSCFLTGTLTSAGDSDTLLTLLLNGKQVDTLTVAGNSYLWETLQPGNYTLTAAKENHVTYRTDLTLVSGENTLNLTLCRPGDVVGIGDLNIGDVANIYAHVKGTFILEGYALDCADVNGDGKVNVGDTAMLYAKIQGN